MKTNNKEDKLKSLFQEMELDSPSFGFKNRLMREIQIRAEKKSQKKNIGIILALIAGIASILVIPAAILWEMGWTIEAEKLNIKTEVSIPHISFDPLILAIAFVALTLLIVDTLIRRRIWEKKQKNM
ncbi:MAG: hypothetical protein E6767_13150 [Dysgonomonas sp.]|nr:hypothetical protein [Dysgonomonas sp.]